MSGTLNIHESQENRDHKADDAIDSIFRPLSWHDMSASAALLVRSLQQIALQVNFLEQGYILRSYILRSHDKILMTSVNNYKQKSVSGLRGSSNPTIFNASPSEPTSAAEVRPFSDTCLDIPDLRDQAVKEYSDWQQSYIGDETLKTDLAKLLGWLWRMI